MFAIMYFLLIRPQRQQQRRHSDLLSSLKPGDEVITAGGIYGEVDQLLSRGYLFPSAPISRLRRTTKRGKNFLSA